MKRFYTVKEAAEILGFSTNTIYKYLDEGKLKGKRIGKGRFKIPYEQLEPFLSVPEKVEHVIEQKTQGDKISEAIKEMEDTVEGIAPEHKDFIFFRFFLGLIILGTGIINLFWPGASTLIGAIRYIFPISLILAGFLSLGASLIWKTSQKNANTADALTILFLSFATFLALFTKNYPLSVFLVSFVLILLRQLIKGFEISNETSSFKKEFIYFTIVIVIVTGFITYMVPGFLSISFISEFAGPNRNLFVILWTLVVVLPVIYLAVKNNKNKLFYFLFSFYAALAFLVGAGASARSVWDLAFGSFVYGVFSAFLIWWTAKGVQLNEKEFVVVTLAFFWVALVIAFGLLSINNLQGKLKASTASRMQGRLSEITKDINTLFTEADGLVDSDAKRNQFAEIILSGDSDEAIETGKRIFEKNSSIKRVLILDTKGLVLGAYPRNSLLQGADRSSREYFQVVKKSLRSYVSSVYESILDAGAVSKAMPVFQGNSLVGMIVISYDLKDLSDRYQSPSSGGDVNAYDENGKYVLSIDKSMIGKDVDPKILELKDSVVYIDEKVLRVYDTASTPRWSTYLERNAVELIEKTSNINNVVSVILMVNAALSLGAAFTVARKWRF